MVVCFSVAGLDHAATAQLIRRLASRFRPPLRKAPIGADVMAGVAVRNALEVVLMFGLGFPEFSCGLYFGYDFSRPESRSINVRNGFLRNAFLFLGCIENGRAIAGSDVISLTILSGRIVNLEKECQQLPIAQLLWIEDYFDRFGVALVIAICCVRNAASGVTDPRGNHAWPAA